MKILGIGNAIVDVICKVEALKKQLKSDISKAQKILN